MPTIIDTVTEYEEKTLELITQVQTQVLDYVKQVVSYLDERLPVIELPEADFLEQIPTAEQVVTTQFAFGKKLLSNQEKFAKNVVKSVKPLTRDGMKAKAEKAAAKAKTEAAAA